MKRIDGECDAVCCHVSRRVLDGAPVVAAYWQEPFADFSGYSLFAAGDEHDDGETVSHDGALICVSCLIDAHPEAGALMDAAHLDASVRSDDAGIAEADGYAFF
jgi:hypothetical protein